MQIIETYRQRYRRKILFARYLRKNQTRTEKIVWQYLRNRKFHGLKFRRQVPLGIYICDFICFQKRIVLEIDGGIHMRQKEYDSQRDQWLESKGFKVIRVSNNEIEQNLHGSMQKLLRYI